MPIDRTSKIPPNQQISDDLRERILSGEFPPGTRIPSMVELEQKWEVARDTIRKATQTLKDEGLVETVTGMGLFVTDPDSRTPADR